MLFVHLIQMVIGKQSNSGATKHMLSALQMPKQA